MDDGGKINYSSFAPQKAARTHGLRECMNKAVSPFALYLPALDLASMLFVGIVFVVANADQ